jgi:uncharacterized protein YjbI with pentapeptide repeats
MHNAGVTSMRAPVSGRDFQLRYSLWRILRLASGREPLEAARARLEAPYRDARGRSRDLDLVLEAADRTILEITECKEHEGDVPARSVTSFLAMADAMRGAPSATGKTRFRLVTDARDLSPGARTALRKGRDLIWELDLPRKDELTAISIVYLLDLPGDGRDHYARLYSLLAAQMAQRLPHEKDDLRHAVRNIHAEIFRNLGARFQRHLNVEPGDAFDIEALRRRFEASASRAERALQHGRELAEAAAGREVLGESGVTLERIFVQPHAELAVEKGTATDLYVGSGEALLLRWLGDLAAGRAPRKPLLVLGHFGFGKSSLLDHFLGTLIGNDAALAPMPIPLRKLAAASPTKSFRSVLTTHVRDVFGVDFDQPPEDDELRYCLLCDGFDELNLYYSEVEPEKWARECFADLASLALRPDVAVIVSSRPILFMSLFAQRMSGQGNPTLWLRPFDDDRIRRWCSKFREAQPKAKELSLDFLRERNLLDVARTPIVLFMVAQVVAGGGRLREKQRYTRAEVYRQFIEWTASGGHRADEPKHKVPPNYRQILQEIAWLIFQSGQPYLREETLIGRLQAKYGRRIGDVLVARNLLVAHMLKPLAGSGEQRQLVEFTHQSFREYLVAERVWDLLSEGRRTGELRPELWRELLGNVVFTDAKIELLGEMVSSLPQAEAQHLYEALARAEQVHQYWNWFSRPAWDELRRDGDVDRAKSYFDTLAPRAMALAALAFLIRIRCLQRLDQLARKSRTPRPKYPDRSELGRLLAFGDSLTLQGIAGNARDLVVRNLTGLRIAREVVLSRLRLDGAVLRDAVLDGVDFSQSTLNDVSLRGCSFRGANLALSAVNVREAADVSFRKCSFNDTTFGLGPNPLLRAVRVDFTGATFDRADIAYLTVHSARFVGNSFEGASFDAQGDELIECELDTAARRFFTRRGVKLIDCRFV